jgi:DNA-directed RNA polymerase specialized sigma24 family protein
VLNVADVAGLQRSGVRGCSASPIACSEVHVKADDGVQEMWIRWRCSDRGTVGDAAAFLVTTTTRLALNVLQSVRARRERPGSARCCPAPMH